MGHRDLLAVTDAGYNIPRDMETVDVALLPNVPTIMQVIEAIQLEVPIEAVYLAEEIKVQAPDILEAYRAHFPDIEFQFLPHVPTSSSWWGPARARSARVNSTGTRRTAC